MSKTVNLAVVGCGQWGKNLVRNFAQRGVLRCICDTNQATLQALVRRYPQICLANRFEEVLENNDIQAVVIATPAKLHYLQARQAILSGKDVFVEKPLALKYNEGKELVDLAETQGSVLMVGHLLRYHPAVMELEKLVFHGDLGRIQYIYSNRLNLGRIRREEDILWSFAPHDISVILGLVGEMPEKVQAQGGYYLHKRIADVTVTCFAFRSGISAHVFVSWLHPYKEQKLVVVGDRKMAVFNDMEESNKLMVYSHTVGWKDNSPIFDPKLAEPVPLKSDEPLGNECDHFIKCVETRARPRTDGQEALRVLEVLTMCQEALEMEENGDSNSVVVGARADGNRHQEVFIHPTADVEDGAKIGAGTKIWHQCHVMSGARIGKNCTLGQNVFVARNVIIGDDVKLQNNVSLFEGVKLEDGVFCGPSMVFTNVINPRSEIERKDEFLPTLVKRGVTLGANCTILCGNKIHEYAFVGAGAVVLNDIPKFALVVGNPARIIGWMCKCGNRIEFQGKEGFGKCVVCRDRYNKDGETVVMI